MVPGLTDEHEARIAGAWLEMLDEIAAGALCRDVLAERGLSKTSVRRYRMADAQRVADWREAIADSAVELNDEHLATLRNTDMDPSRMRAKLNGLEWQMAKRDPDRYADRSRHDINVKTLDLGPILARAEARLAAQRVVEGEVLRPALGAVQQSADPELDLANSLF